MKLGFSIFIFLILGSQWVGANSPVTPERRAPQTTYWEADPAQFETSIGGMIVGLIGNLGPSEFSSAPFRTALTETGIPIRAIFNATNIGRSISRQICGLPADNNNGDFTEHQNETDALRHFSMSAYLASTVGEPRANLLMSSREVGRAVGPYDLMDQHNNLLGLDFGRYLYMQRSQGATEEQILQRIQDRGRQLLNSGQLSVLSSGGKFETPGCTLFQYYPNTRHENVDVASLFVIDGTVPQSCNTAVARSICGDRRNTRGMLFCLSRVLRPRAEQNLEQANAMAAANPIFSRSTEEASVRIRGQLEACQRDLARIQRAAEATRPPSHVVDAPVTGPNYRSEVSN